MREQEAIINTINVLRLQVKVFTLRLKPAGTGYLITAIDVINNRIDELIEEVTAPYWKDEDGDIGRLPGQTRSSHLRSIEGAFEQEDVYDGYQEHIEVSRKPNSVRDAYLHSSTVKDEIEHTDEYYDRGRNRPMEGEDLPITEGLSNRSMKQKHGQAVMTVSEMMQEELEPLPINTFE